jgi:hypothetical protein
MLKKTELHDAALRWIRGLPRGRLFTNEDLYRVLERDFGDECSPRGDAATEPRYKNDARWAVQDAKIEKIVRPGSHRGEYRRV